MLKHLVKLKYEGPSRPSSGICRNVTLLGYPSDLTLGTLLPAFQCWPDRNPVDLYWPIKPEQEAVNDEDWWVGCKARWDLLDHCIDYFVWQTYLD
jgi:hypothetical protein